jgi:hypothetical protein
MSDKTILEHVSELVAEEHRLRESADAADKSARLRHVQEQLDQCWDLLRQRRALREFGGDADQAAVRDPKTVEGYIG